MTTAHITVHVPTADCYNRKGNPVLLSSLRRQIGVNLSLDYLGWDNSNSVYMHGNMGHSPKYKRGLTHD